ncbi:alanyl-tRNA synthetase [Coemansia reversa NRRL 1564]|uniref:Alanine--tRNA ligase n=1 Tax=Coemansia reversa (strain ATCC 12441 / NRRL 1564) TaxID=763665 RepID=A0A2G5BBG1_COERN|nr:alanyl-tRNA synthetase [Coemansia reversa NRRL 1564]|eukprot:PIA16346.1 alanyl-tRNA synthetase [Coemansia reversa NRRL 1564]
MVSLQSYCRCILGPRWRPSVQTPPPSRVLQTARKRNLSNMSASEIRRRYTDYFVRNGHSLLGSADIVPKSDPSLLFTNAGMVPFKQFFLHPHTAPHKMITTVQKCIRAGGKHNDLDQVGYTPRHHTFFEMLGNFSFGAYGKREIIRIAWRFIQDELQIPEKLLRVTVLESDNETYSIWRDDIGLDPRRIVRCGPKDNFWSMGSGEGPCGPSSEIFWDTGDTRYAEDDEGRWLEFWNLVFMQFHRGTDGVMQPLDIPCIDTGMGLERVAAIMQGKTNNFDTDEFQTIIGGIDRLPRSKPFQPVEAHVALTCKRIIADHLRASSFLISEGVCPSNTGRGYVLRRIIRRAARAGRRLGLSSPVLPALYPSLETAMGGVYPELIQRRDHIVGVLESEERVFEKALDKGMVLLEGIFFKAEKNAAKILSGADAFMLYDTHGFPIDLTQIIAKDNGWTVDIDEFDRIQRQSRLSNKMSWKGRSARHDSSTVVAYRELSDGDALLVIDPSPFYAMGGGQEADTGAITVAENSNSGALHQFAVSRAVVLADGHTTVLHLTDVADKQYLLSTGQHVTATVDMRRRYGNAVHHTATHLLHAALQKIVGSSVRQTGSQVHFDGLRFDFTSSALSEKQLRDVEKQVNEAALSNVDIYVNEMTLEDAKACGATALFGDKYNPQSVRVVEVPGISMELCGGTHLHRTKAVFPFHIIAECSVGAGTRRIEAVAGVAGSAWLQKQLEHTRVAAGVLGANRPSDLGEKAQRLADKAKAEQEEVEQWLRFAAANVQPMATHATALGKQCAPTLIQVLPQSERFMTASSSAQLVAARASHLRDSEPHFVHVVVQGKAIALGMSPENFPGMQAGKLLRELLCTFPGKGGGASALAQGVLENAVTDIAQLKSL